MRLVTPEDRSKGNRTGGTQLIRSTGLLGLNSFHPRPGRKSARLMTRHGKICLGLARKRKVAAVRLKAAQTSRVVFLSGPGPEVPKREWSNEADMHVVCFGYCLVSGPRSYSLGAKMCLSYGRLVVMTFDQAPQPPQPSDKEINHKRQVELSLGVLAYVTDDYSSRLVSA